MSLFENGQYRWRETFFVLFDRKHRPMAADMAKCLAELGSRYELAELRADDDGRFESLTLLSPMDYAAMDVTYICGEDVVEQVTDLKKEMKGQPLGVLERAKLQRLSECDARFEIYHFEQVVDSTDEDEDEFLDPGALLIVLQKLAKLCHGVGIDPQSGALM